MRATRSASELAGQHAHWAHTQRGGHTDSQSQLLLQRAGAERSKINAVPPGQRQEAGQAAGGSERQRACALTLRCIMRGATFCTLKTGRPTGKAAPRCLEQAQSCRMLCCAEHWRRQRGGNERSGPARVCRLGAEEEQQRMQGRFKQEQGAGGKYEMNCGVSVACMLLAASSCRPHPHGQGALGSSGFS